MTRLIALIALLLAAYAPAAARAMPAMACCPQAMAKAMHHGEHRPALPGDAADCAVPAAMPATPLAQLAAPPALFAIIAAAPVRALSGRLPPAELRPPRRT
ncbi:DUF2946 family protein [Sphingomonas quercus]|uniref:Uncharacterized protein n=1 Tax=Sphingomonas quercus TaxID=2842451 RepID=A0ABS6BIT2_9SPHN|nr:DUF2946 family protein [Sphingomonas quercus]MBU3077095.1 hypothetical protein [Sphingomonas quercus]